MGEILCFNNKLSFLNSVTTLIIDASFFLGIANYGNKVQIYDKIFQYVDFGMDQFFMVLRTLSLD
jgi:hypothetical protein